MVGEGVKILNNKLVPAILLFFILSTINVIVFSSCSERVRQEKIYGIWIDEYGEEKLLFRFEYDGTCLLHIKDNNSGTIEAITGEYEFDYSKEPITLTIKNIPQLNHTLHSIVEFITDDSIRIENFSPHWKLRPISFNYNTSMILKRIE